MGQIGQKALKRPPAMPLISQIPESITAMLAQLAHTATMPTVLSVPRRASLLDRYEARRAAR